MLNATKILSLATDNTASSILEIINLCKQEIVEETAKIKGGNSLLKRTKLAQKLISKMDDWKIKKHGAHFDIIGDKTYQVFGIDGYYVFALEEPLEGLLPSDDDHANYSRCFNKAIYSNPITITNKDIVELETHIRIKKAEQPKKTNVLYDFGKKRYNAEYLLNCYTILGGDITLYQNDSTFDILESQNGKALICNVKQ